MAELQPQAKRMLGTMLREMEQTVLPDLSSAHAKTVAYLITQGLRNFLARQDAIPELLDDWNRTSSALVVQAAQSWAPGEPNPVSRMHMLGRILEKTVSDRMTSAANGAPDDLCLSAIRAECDFHAAQAEAIKSVTPAQRSTERVDLMAVTPQKLTEYFRRKLPQYCTLEVKAVTPMLSGFSKETILVDMEIDGVAAPVVIRRNISAGAVETSVVDEFPVVAALYRHGLPVPEPFLLEPDEKIFGEAFAVTHRAPGNAATNSMAGLVAGPELHGAALELAAFLGRLHQVDLPGLNLPQTYFDPALSTHDYLIREIDICERYYRNHAQQPSTIIAAALAWLRANVPQVEGDPRMVHGDAGLSNMLMDGDRMSVMLDWELSHPGDAIEDLIYTRKWVDQIMPWEEFIAHYYRHGGIEYRPEREKFYAMLSDLRVAVFAVRAQDMLNKTDHPEMTQVYAVQHYYGYFLGNVAKGLLSGT